jgi:ADP-heptose:LPS heptosyltransferase
MAAPLGRFDLAVDLRLWPDTRPLLAAIDAGVRAGYADTWTGAAALDIVVMTPSDGEFDPRRGRTLHEQTRAQILVAAVLNSVRPPARPAAALLSAPGADFPEGPYLAVAPGAGTSIKIWSTDLLARVVARIAERYDLRVVILALPAEAELAARLREALPPDRVSDLTGRTSLTQLPAIIDGARLYVGMDSGLTHLAAGLDVPTLCVFSGATRKDAWRPVGPKVRVVRGGAACSPCFLAHREQCPHGMACMSAVGVEQVAAAADALLGRPR